MRDENPPARTVLSGHLKGGNMPEITLKITWHQFEALQAIAEKAEVSPGELIRRALDEFTVLEQQRLQLKLDDPDTGKRDFGEGPEEVLNPDI
jgi:hypothetical protein